MQDSRFGLPPTYRHRARPAFFDDTPLRDVWQREVYAFAADLMRRERWQRVHDLGCGSGYKLVHTLGAFETAGFELEPTLSFLQETYPDRAWHPAPPLGAAPSLPPADLVLCADVIEHVADPDAMLRTIAMMTRGPVVLSTPCRALLYPPGSPRRRGPPANPSHAREWEMGEFADYLGSRGFRVAEHRISNRRQATQLVLAWRPEEGEG